MKLCRFELKSDPGKARSGMVYSGKIYETDGSEAVAVYEADQVRPLSPIPNAPSLRIFRADLQPDILDREEPDFYYGNPTSCFGASQVIQYPDAVAEVSFQTYFAAILVSDGYQVSVAQADEIILAYTMVISLIARGLERMERRIGAIGRSSDLGGVIGPVLTTPEELEDSVESEEFGRHFGLSTVGRVNGVEKLRGSTGDLPFTFGQAISVASQFCPVRTGDIIALGPVTSGETILLDPGDEVQLSIESLGTLALKTSRSI